MFQTKIKNGKKFCTKCKEEKDVSKFGFYTDKRYKKKFIYASCKLCSQKVSTAWKRKNPKRNAATSRKVNLKRKIEVLSFYSGGTKPICCKCGYDDLRALCLDHVQNDGFKENKKERSGTGLYSKAKREQDRTKYQVLCSNCNLIKEIECKASRYHTYLSRENIS